jgi:hypothetical protein
MPALKYLFKNTVILIFCGMELGLQKTRSSSPEGQRMNTWNYKAMFLTRRAAAQYWALASIIPGREMFSWNLSFYFSKYLS